jgi:hypothetical protein
MAGRDTRSPDPDDWFAEPELAPSRRPRQRPTRPPAGVPGSEADEDDWIGDDLTSPRQGPTFASSLPDRWVPIAAGVLLLAILVVGGLALAGVFSGSNAPQAVTTAQIQSTPTRTTTTARTTTQVAGTSVPAPTTTLKPGDTGPQVKALQRALAQLGYSVGTIDGDYGPSTQTALEKFQSAAGLTADGVFGPTTRAALIRALKTG